jgi:hypothetical protein
VSEYQCYEFVALDRPLNANGAKLGHLLRCTVTAA